MSQNERDRLLANQLESLSKLSGDSSILDFQHQGDPPEEYQVTFRGLGISGIDDDGNPIFTDSHQILIQMAYLYPDRGPDLKWETPIFHPNVSNSGFVDLRDIGLQWDPKMDLEIICERLWDVIRLAYVDIPGAKQLAARDWFRTGLNLNLPLDARTLRDRDQNENRYIVQYTRRAKAPENRAGQSQTTSPNITPIGNRPERNEREVLFIGDDPESTRDTTPESPAPQPPEPPTKENRGDSGILYID